MADGLRQRWSPRQICHALAKEYPDDQDMRVSAETVLPGALRPGPWCAPGGRRRPAYRARPPQAPPPGSAQPRFVDPMVMISERPAEVEDRAVPGHWEGDLIIGAGNASAIGTLVERATRYVMLGAPARRPHRRGSPRSAGGPCIGRLPAHLRRIADLGPGIEMAAHRHSSRSRPTVPVYFCDPHHPGSAAQRKHQRPAAPVLPQGHRPVRPRHPRPRRRRRQNSTAAHEKRSAGKTQPSACVIY